MQPKVSIMMPAYNAGAFIAMAIESVLKQTWTNWELIIHDDGSSDGTLNVALEFAEKDTRIKVSSSKNEGCPSARNRCLARVKGDIVARQDADDLQSPDRIARQVNQLLASPVDIVTCKMFWLEGGELKLKNAGPMDPDKYLAGKGGSPVCASVVAWADVYTEVGGFDESMLAGSDGDWNFRALKAGKVFGFVPEPLYIQRRHAGQISKTLRAQQRRNHENSRLRNRPR
jgi:glycosyltransferase EpsE